MSATAGRATLGAPLAAALAAALALACACGGSPPAGADSARAAFRRPKTGAQVADSARVAALAVEALAQPAPGRRPSGARESVALRVDQFTRGSDGYQVRLLPAAGGTAGGGTVWIDDEGVATVVKRY